VAVYIRWSTDEQTEGTTLEIQRERCSLYIRSQGWDFSEDLVFVDEGYSGGSLDRPALARLREFIRAGRVDCVVAYSIDRLSRNLGDITELVGKEWAGRSVFRSATQPIGTDEGNPTGQLVFNILASFAEFERGLIRERTHAGSVRRAKEGKYPGGPVAPYGYVRVGVGSLAIDESKAAIVRQMYEMATSGPYGQGPAVIARALNERGVPAPAGGKWWAYSVREMLRNPVYAGTVAFGRRKSNPAHVRDKSVPRRSKRETPLALVEDAVPALVAREVWERAQELEKERSAKYAKKGVQASNRALLTGLAVCRCGGPLHTFYKEGRKRYYRCSRNAQAGGCEHTPGIYYAEELEQVVVDEVMKRYGTPELREAALRQLEQKLSADNARQEYLASLEQIDQRLKQLEGELARLKKGARSGEIKLSTYEELKADVDEEMKDLLTNRRGIETALAHVRDNTGAVEGWKRNLAAVDLWHDLDPMRQREVLFGLLRRVTVHRLKGSTEPVAIHMIWEAALS
jgi:site-specific DNA recombinase